MKNLAGSFMAMPSMVWPNTLANTLSHGINKTPEPDSNETNWRTALKIALINKPPLHLLSNLPKFPNYQHKTQKNAGITKNCHHKTKVDVDKTKNDADVTKVYHHQTQNDDDETKVDDH